MRSDLHVGVPSSLGASIFDTRGWAPASILAPVVSPSPYGRNNSPLAYASSSGSIELILVSNATTDHAAHGVQYISVRVKDQNFIGGLPLAMLPGQDLRCSAGLLNRAEKTGRGLRAAAVRSSPRYQVLRPCDYALAAPWRQPPCLQLRLLRSTMALHAKQHLLHEIWSVTRH